MEPFEGEEDAPHSGFTNPTASTINGRPIAGRVTWTSEQEVAMYAFIAQHAIPPSPPSAAYYQLDELATKLRMINQPGQSAAAQGLVMKKLATAVTYRAKLMAREGIKLGMYADPDGMIVKRYPDWVCKWALEGWTGDRSKPARGQNDDSPQQPAQQSQTIDLVNDGVARQPSVEEDVEMDDADVGGAELQHQGSSPVAELPPPANGSERQDQQDLEAQFKLQQQRHDELCRREEELRREEQLQHQRETELRLQRDREQQTLREQALEQRERALRQREEQIRSQQQQKAQVHDHQRREEPQTPPTQVCTLPAQTKTPPATLVRRPATPPVSQRRAPSPPAARSGQGKIGRVMFVIPSPSPAPPTPESLAAKRSGLASSCWAASDNTAPDVSHPPAAVSSTPSQRRPAEPIDKERTGMSPDLAPGSTPQASASLASAPILAAVAPQLDTRLELTPSGGNGRSLPTARVLFPQGQHPQPQEPTGMGRCVAPGWALPYSLPAASGLFDNPPSPPKNPLSMQLGPERESLTTIFSRAKPASPMNIPHLILQRTRLLSQLLSLAQKRQRDEDDALVRGRAPPSARTLAAARARDTHIRRLLKDLAKTTEYLVALIDAGNEDGAYSHETSALSMLGNSGLMIVLKLHGDAYGDKWLWG